MSSERGQLVVLSGPSGSGKSTICRRLALRGDVTLSVSATTRPPRPGEVDGREYRFLSDEAFQKHVDAGDFLEHARVFERRYGTLRSTVDEQLATGDTVILEIDVQGCDQVRASGTAARLIFVAAPNDEVLERRLRERRSESEEQIALRLSIARGEMERQNEYDFVVINDNLDRAVAEVEAHLGLPSMAEDES